MCSDKFYLYTTRILAIAAFATSVFSCFMAFHKVTFNEQPYVDDVFGIQCSILHNEAKELCETSHNTRFYSLFQSFGNFFLLEDFDGTLCGQRYFQFPINSVDIQMVTTGNLGDCSDKMGEVAAIFTLMTASFSGLLTFYLLVVQDFLLASPRYAHTFVMGQFLLIFWCAACCSVAMGIYKLEIDPLRLEEQFCRDQQTTFEYCKEETGNGFWMLVSTLAAHGLALLLTLLWIMTGSPPGRQGVQAISSTEKKGGEEHQSHGPWYCSLHFWIQFIKFSELAILVVGISTSFTTIKATLGNNDNSVVSTAAIRGGRDVTFQMETEITLWQDLFCHPFGSKLFMWSVALDDHPEVTQDSFGECDEKDVLECRMGYFMALFTSVNALAFQKDPKTMPLAFVIGFIMHFMSMVKLSWAIGAFMTTVFPGRKEIDPPYCHIWIQYAGEGSTCSIEPGLGLILTGAALGTVFISFVGEIILQQTAEYGVGTAFRTLTRRIKEGRWKDILNETSERDLGVAAGEAENTSDDDDEEEPAPPEQPKEKPKKKAKKSGDDDDEEAVPEQPKTKPKKKAKKSDGDEEPVPEHPKTKPKKKAKKSVKSRS